MADFRPFRALRYDPAVAGDAAGLVAPPYDIVFGAAREAVYARSPFNIARADYGPDQPGDGEAVNRYTRARRDLDDWRRRGVLKRDEAPSLYVYDQEFRAGGELKRRRAVFGRLRLEEWDRGIVLPHEQTLAAAKADRLQLLRATGVHLSPVLALYRPDLALRFGEDEIGAPVLDAVLPAERHTLRRLSEAAAARFSAGLKDARLYIADGHHRYETGLNYRNERRAEAAEWTGEEPENFIVAALVDASDPGLVVLPIHRLLRFESQPDLEGALSDVFDIERVDGVDKLTSALAAAGRNDGNAYGAIGPDGGTLRLLRLRDRAAADARTPADRSEQWRRLDVSVLHHGVLPVLGFEQTPDNIDFTEDAHEAAEAVAAGRWDAVFLLNPTQVDQIIAVADAGERMPQKSTFFFPKLATGVVMLPVDDAPVD